MRLALIDSGLGMVQTASLLVEAEPTLDLVLAMDPDFAPWGPRSTEQVVERCFVGVRAAQRHGRVDAVVVPCNTASVAALDALRAELEPGVPVIGTVPAIKPAAARFDSFAVWATESTSRSAYQRGLIETFAAGRQVTAVACPGMAEAIDSGDPARIDVALGIAVRATPAVPAIVLGCTHYPLIGERILRRLPDLALIDSAPAVARQTLRRLAGLGRPPAGTGRLEVIRSGRPGALPTSVGAYPQGRRLLNQLAASR